MPNPRFLGEQDGMPEAELKARLIVVFGRRRTVASAYLARVEYPGQPSVAVALCLRTQPGLEQNLVAEVSEVFSKLFSQREHLDVLFLTDEMEAELKVHCHPFFSQ